MLRSNLSAWFAGRSWRPWLVVLCASLLAVGLPSTSQAARTITVCASGCDYTTITAAISAARSGETIQVSAGTYAENVTIHKPLTIIGAGPARTIIASAVGHQPVVTVAAHPVRLAELTVTGAEESGSTGISNNGHAVLTLDHVKVSQNGGDSNDGVGGGIDNNGTMTINDSIISNNGATRGTSGGGIGNSGTLTINSSTISGNTATVNGGAIANSGTLTLIDSVVSGNSASTLHGEGGGLYITAGSATFKHSQIVNNSASDGGAIFSAAGTRARLVDTQVSGNSKPQCEPTTLCK